MLQNISRELSAESYHRFLLISKFLYFTNDDEGSHYQSLLGSFASYIYLNDIQKYDTFLIR